MDCCVIPDDDLFGEGRPGYLILKERAMCADHNLLLRPASPGSGLSDLKLKYTVYISTGSSDCKAGAVAIVKLMQRLADERARISGSASAAERALFITCSLRRAPKAPKGLWMDGETCYIADAVGDTLGELVDSCVDQAGVEFSFIAFDYACAIPRPVFTRNGAMYAPRYSIVRTTPGTDIDDARRRLLACCHDFGEYEVPEGYGVVSFCDPDEYAKLIGYASRIRDCIRDMEDISQASSIDDMLSDLPTPPPR